MKPRVCSTLLALAVILFSSRILFAAELREYEGYSSYVATDLLGEVKANRMRFDKTYGGKTFSLGGIVGNIEEKEGSYLLQLFGDDDNPLNYIQCYFPASQEEALFDLNSGDLIIIEGTYEGKENFDAGAFVMKKCSFKMMVTSAEDTKTDTENIAAAIRILNDLRNLKGASLMFFVDNEKWPTQSDVNKLDQYMDRPFIGTNPPRYKKIWVSDAINDEKGQPHLFIGIELTPKENGTPSVRKKLADRAAASGLYSLSKEGDVLVPYTIYSDIVWMYLN
jgi:hypothetical protein